MVFICIYVILAVVLAATAVPFQEPPDNHTQIFLRNKCVDSWADCLNPETPEACSRCEHFCSASLKVDSVCILLNNYCINVNNGVDLHGCRDPNCIYYHDNCDGDPNSRNCTGCMRTCQSSTNCETQYYECGGTSNVEIRGCGDRVCNYYEALCESNPGPNSFFCGKCIAGCHGLPDCVPELALCSGLSEGTPNARMIRPNMFRSLASGALSFLRKPSKAVPRSPISQRSPRSFPAEHDPRLEAGAPLAPRPPYSPYSPSTYSFHRESRTGYRVPPESGVSYPSTDRSGRQSSLGLRRIRHY